MKKLLSMLLAVMMVVGMFPMTAVAAEAEIPAELNMVDISAGSAFEKGETYDFTQWGSEKSAPSWVVTVPAGTESVTVAFKSDAVPSPYSDWNTGELVLSGGMLRYDAENDAYVLDGSELSCDNSSGNPTITLDVKSMIENGNYYGVYDANYGVQYLLGFKYEEETGVAFIATADKTEAEIGDTVEVTFEIKDNTGFTNIELTLDFDTDVLKFTGLKVDPDTESYEGKFGGGATVANTNVYSDKYGFITNARASATSTDGKLFVAQFEVIGSGETTVGANISLMENSGVAVEYISKATPSETVTVKGLPATAISLDKTEISLEEGGNKKTLTATVEPADTSDEIVWTSSDENVATVNKGIVTSVKAGTATITATAGSVSAECVVTVTPEENIIRTSKTGYSDFVYAEMTGVKSIQFNGEALEIRNIYKVTLQGHEETYLHNTRSSFGSEFNGYKLDGTLAVGDGSWGTSMEKLYLNGTWGYQTKECVVSYDELKAAVGEENMEKLGVTEDDILGVMVFKKASATFNYVVLFDIEPVAINGISITEKATIGVGKTTTLSAEVTPAETTEGANIVWTSSDESVATVDENGVVTGVAEGKATITATVGEYSDTCEVEVSSKFVEITAPDNDVWGTKLESIAIIGVSVDSYKWTEEGSWSGTNRTLTVYIDDESGEALVTYKTNQGSETRTVAIVNYEGTDTYTLSGGWVTDNFTVEFKKAVHTTILELDKTEMEVTVGYPETITATLSEGTTDTVVWTSSDESIATVDENGVVTGITDGEVVITATAGNLSAECKVTVKTVHAESVSIAGEGVEDGKLRLKLWSYVLLEAIIEPERVTDEIVWSSSDSEVAVISPDGYVQGYKAGTATITLTVGEKTASIEVEVYEIPAESLTLDKTEIELLTGENTKITATVTPEDHTDGNVEWSSSDESVATVSRGTVTGVAAGEATITAKIGDLEATCKVTVTEPEEGTVIWSYDGNVANGWPQWMSYSYGVNMLIMSGAKYESVTNDGDNYTVTLPHSTAKDAEISLEVLACGSYPEHLGVNWNNGSEGPDSWEGYENTLEYSFKLVDGTATVKVRAYKGSGNGASREGTKTFTFVINPEHTFDQQTATEEHLASAADCENAAVYYVSCVCGENGTETFTHGEALGHKGGEANCVSGPICEACGKEYGEPDADNHKLHYETVTAPTCEEEGKCVITCENGCDYHEEKVIEALGHDWSAWKTVKYPTYTEAGLSERVCERCGETETKIIPKLTYSEDKPNPGVTVIVPKDDEENPNTGAPVVSATGAIGAMAVLAGAAVVITKMNKR